MLLCKFVFNADETPLKMSKYWEFQAVYLKT